MNPITTESSFIQTFIHALLFSKHTKSLPLLTGTGPQTRHTSGRNYVAGMRRKAKINGRRTFKVYGKTRHV